MQPNCATYSLTVPITLRLEGTDRPFLAFWGQAEARRSMTLFKNCTIKGKNGGQPVDRMITSKEIKRLLFMQHGHDQAKLTVRIMKLLILKNE